MGGVLHVNLSMPVINLLKQSMVVMKARRSDRWTAPSNTIGLHPAAIPSLVPIYEPGSVGVEPCQNPNDEGRVG